MTMETGPSIGLSDTSSSFFATQKTVSTDLGIDNAQSHADPNKLPTENSNGFTATFRSSRQTLSSYGVERRSSYCTPNSSQKDNNTPQHRPLLRQPPTVEQIEGLVLISGSGFERKCIHSPAERHHTVGVSDQNRPIAHPNSSVGDTNIDAFSFIKDDERLDGHEIHSQRASSDVERHAELSENLPSLEGQQSVDNSIDYFSFLSETRDTDFIIRLESIEIQDTESLDLSSLDVPKPERPTQNEESTSELKDCLVTAVSHDRNKKWQFTGTSFDEPTSINQNSDFDEDETFLKIPVTSPSRILNEESTDVENHSEWTTTHAPAEEEQSVGSFQNYFSTQSKSLGVWKENNLGSLSPFSNQPEKDIINPKIPSNPEIPTNEAVCLEIPTDTDNLSVEQSSEESVTDDVVWYSSIHHEVFTLRKPGFMTRSLHMQSTDEVLPVEQSRSLTSTEQQSFSCSVSYFSLPSKTYLCNQVGDSILCLPSRVSCGEDSLNPNNRDSDQCLGGSNEDTSINGSSSMTHDLYLDDLQTLWVKFEIFLRILYLRSTCEKQHFEESTNRFAEDAQQCIIRVLRDSSTRSKIRNENCSLIEEENSHQSLETNIVGQSSKCENVTNTMILSQSNETAVSLMDKHIDVDKKIGGTAKDTSISSYSQSQKVALDDDAPLPIDTNTINTNMNPGSPLLQLTDDERHSEDFLNHSAPKLNQCNDSFKNQLTQTLTQNDCELRILKDSSFQSLDEDLRVQNSWWKNATNSESLIKNLDEASTDSVLDTCDIGLVERSNESIKDTSIGSYSQSGESDFDDEALLPIDTNMSPGYPHLQLTDDKRHAGVFMNHLAPEIHQCNDSFKDCLTQSTTQNACEWRIQRDDFLQGFDADFREQSPWWKYALNLMTLNQHIDAGNLDTSIGRYSQSRELDFDNDARLPMDTNVNPGSEHLQLTNVERHQYSPPYSAKKFDEHEVQQCKEISQMSSPKRKNTTIQESPHVGENSSNSTKCIKNENSDNPKDTNDADLQEGVNTDKCIGRCPEITEEFLSDEDAKLPMEIELNSRSEHLQSTNIQRHPCGSPYIAKKYDEMEVQRCNEISQKSSPKRKNSDKTIQKSLHVGENSASSTKCIKNANSDNPKDTNDAELQEGVNTDKSIGRCPEIREEFNSDEDATLPKEIELNSRDKKFDEPEVQRCKEISQKYSPKQKNSDTTIQESPPVSENSASSTKCKKNENSDSPRDTKDADLHEGVNTDKSIDTCPEIREEFHSDEDATLPMEIELNSSPPYSAKKFDEHEVQQCKEISQKSSPKRNNSDTTIQESPPVGENSASPTKCIKNENSDNPKDTNDADLHEGINTDKSIDRCPEIGETFYSDEDATLPMEIELNSRSEHLQSTTIQRHPYSPPYRDRKFDEPEVQRCKAVHFSQKYSSKRNNSDTTIQEYPHVDENSASSTKCKKNENSEDSLRDTNDADLHEGVNTDKSIDRCHEIREEFHSDEDATLPMEIELNSRSNHLQSTNIQRHPYSPPYRAKKFVEPEVQRCEDISQKSSSKRKNSDTTIQESPVGENSASSTKCKKNENSDSPRDTNDADLHEGVNTDKSIDRCPEIRVEFHSDEDSTLSIENELNSRCRQSTQNMTQNACGTNQESIFLLSKEADIRCRSSSMEIKLSPESPTINNDITNQGMLRAKTGTASKEKQKMSTMKVAENSVSLTQNKEIRIPESLGNKPNEKSSYEPTTDTCIDRYYHMSQEVDSNENAVVTTESKINPRSQYLQLIDVERHSENSMNYFEAEVQQCNNISCNLFPTENETHYIWDNCLEVGRCFENQDGATQRRGTLLEDATELDENEFTNGSTTDRISMYGDVVTIYGSAPQSESSCWLGEQHYEVRLSATVRPIDGHNSLMWDDRMEDDDAVMSGQHLASSEDTMDSTDTLPSIRQLLSSSCVQLRTSFIGFNSFQRDSNPSRHVPLSTEANKNESIPYEMDEEFVTISGSGSLHELFNGSEERRFRFSERVRPYNN